MSSHASSIGSRDSLPPDFKLPEEENPWRAGSAIADMVVALRSHRCERSSGPYSPVLRGLQLPNRSAASLPPPGQRRKAANNNKRTTTHRKMCGKCGRTRQPRKNTKSTRGQGRLDGLRSGQSIETQLREEIFSTTFPQSLPDGRKMRGIECPLVKHTARATTGLI